MHRSTVIASDCTKSKSHATAHQLHRLIFVVDAVRRLYRFLVATVRWPTLMILLDSRDGSAIANEINGFQTSQLNYRENIIWITLWQTQSKETKVYYRMPNVVILIWNTHFIAKNSGIYVARPHRHTGSTSHTHIFIEWKPNCTNGAWLILFGVPLVSLPHSKYRCRRCERKNYK